MAGRKVDFHDTCVIYRSPADECWIAHSLRTDQIGTGECVLDALTDLLRALKQLLKLKEEDPDVVVWRSAPARIRQMAARARQLPRELFEIAHKRVEGEWPADLSLSVSPKPRRRARRYRADIEETALV